jgi:Phage capsid protein
MSQSLTAVQQTDFDELVKAEYRSKGFLLRDSVRLKNDVIGASEQFRKVDQVISVPTAYLAAVTIQDPDYTKVTCLIQKYTTPTAVDTVQELTVNFDAKMENAMLVGQGMGRRSDQIIIDAVAANPGQTIPDGGTNFNYLKFTEVYEYFENNAVPKGERWIAMSASNVRSLMQDDQFVSTFYTENRILDRGWVLDYLGINLVTIPQMTEGGLPKTGNIRTALAWHKMSTGMAIGHDFRTEINYIPDRTSWLVNGIFSAGAVVIDNRGVIAINCDESV